MSSPVTTHVLDTAKGKPAKGVPVVLKRKEGTTWREVGQGVTDADGRVSELLKESFMPGTYRLVFDTGEYFKGLNTQTFYPYVMIVFTVKTPTEHHHVPLLLSPFGYSTYRGS